MEKIVLLLTGCIDPTKSVNNIWHKLNDADLRLAQYLDAIKYFVAMTDVPIVFVENSGYDLSEIEFINNLKSSGRLEVFSYLASEDTRVKGKGYGEQDIIKYAIEHSVIIQSASYIVKITGRIKIKNIKNLINKTKRINENPGKWVVAEKLYKANWIQSYCFIAHKDFFDESFFINMHRISESIENLVTFEECLIMRLKIG